MWLILAVLSAAVVTGGSAALTAQVLTERNMSLQLARTLADAANPHNAELARRKAYTARTYGVTTLEFRNRTNGTDLAGQRELTDIIALGGLGLSGAP